MELAGHFLYHQYVSDFCDFYTILKRLKSLFEWYQDNKNPIHIDDKESAQLIPSSFGAIVIRSLKDRLINLRRAQQKSKARLNTVLNRPPQTSIGKPSTLVPTFFSFEVDTLQTLTLANRPLLRGVQEKVQRWQAVERLAKLASRPDFDVSVGYRQRPFMLFDPVRGSDFLSVGVMLNLPIYQGSKQDNR